MDGVQVPVIADVSQSMRATKDLAGGFDKVADSLDEVARTGNLAGSDVDRSLGKVETAATEATRTVERKFRDAFDEVKRTTSRATDDVARTTRADMERASQGVEDLNRNAASNAKEFAASWDGSAQGALDSVQGFIAESLEGFGTMGVVGGVALAAIGGALLTSMNEATEQSKQRVRDMFDDMRASKAAYLSEQSIDDELAKIASSADDAVISWAKVEEAAKTAGVTSGTVARAYAGDQEAAQRYTDAVAAKLQKIADNHGVITNEMDLERNALWDLQDQWAKRSGEFDKASQAYKQYAASAEESEDRAREAVEATREGIRGMRDDASQPISIPVSVDLTEAKRTLNAWRPDVTVVARIGKPQVT